MCMGNVLMGGAHRGGESMINHLQHETVRCYAPNWILADPKPDRASQLAKVAQHRFPTLQPQPVQMKVQDSLALSHEHDTVVLALDTINDTTQTLQARLPSQRVTFQLVGRGPGDAAGTRLAIHGTICPDDHDTERRALLFLHTLAGMSQAASSRRLTGPDPLSAVVLTPLRRAVSDQTIKHLAEKEREPWDLSGGPLSVLFGPTIYPLIPVQGERQDTYPQWEARALDAVGEVPAKLVASRGVGGGSAYVAVIIPETRAIHFMKVVQDRRGHRSIAGVTTFQSRRVPSASFTDAAMFTD